MSNNLYNSLSKAFATTCRIIHTPVASLHATAGLQADEKPLPPGYRPPQIISLILKETYQPHMKVTEAGKLAGEKYRNLSSDELQEYKKKVQAIADERRKEFECLDINTQKKLYEDAAEKLRKSKLRKHRAEIRTRNEETNRPTRPLNSYILFVNKERERSNPSADKLTDFISQAAVKWREMDAKAKEPFKREAQHLREKYLTAVSQWKDEQKALKKSAKKVTA